MQENRNSMMHVAKIVCEVDQLIRQYGMKVCIESGVKFSDDDYGKVKARFSIVQIARVDDKAKTNK